MSLKLMRKAQSRVLPCLPQAPGRVNSVVLRVPPRVTEKALAWSSCWTPMFSESWGLRAPLKGKVFLGCSLLSKGAILTLQLAPRRGPPFEEV